MSTHRMNADVGTIVAGRGRRATTLAGRMLALAGLALALASLAPAAAPAKSKCPASALAEADGKCRSVKSSGTQTIRLNTQTLQFSTEGTATSTQTGEGPFYTSNGQLSLIGFTPPNLVRFAAEADVRIVAANGDELYGDLTFTTEPFAVGGPHRDDGEITITGGSGRFEGAQGELSTIINVGPGTFVQEDGVTWMISHAQVATTGYLVY